jgi:hypothetical protein
MAQCQPMADLTPLMVAVGRAVVGHDPLNPHALTRELADRALKEGHCAFRRSRPEIPI